MSKFRRKPKVIEAVQFRPRARTWPPNVYETGGMYYVRTASGDVEIMEGDWICAQRVNRKLDTWPMKPVIFEATHEAV